MPPLSRRFRQSRLNFTTPSADPNSSLPLNPLPRPSIPATSPPRVSNRRPSSRPFFETRTPPAKELRSPVDDDWEMGKEVALGLLKGTKMFEEEGGGGGSESDFEDVGEVRKLARKRGSLRKRNAAVGLRDDRGSMTRRSGNRGRKDGGSGLSETSSEEAEERENKEGQGKSAKSNGSRVAKNLTSMFDSDSSDAQEGAVQEGAVQVRNKIRSRARHVIQSDSEIEEVLVHKPGRRRRIDDKNVNGTAEKRGKGADEGSEPQVHSISTDSDDAPIIRTRKNQVRRSGNCQGSLPNSPKTRDAKDSAQGGKEKTLYELDTLRKKEMSVFNSDIDGEDGSEREPSQREGLTAPEILTEHKGPKKMPSVPKNQQEKHYRRSSRRKSPSAAGSTGKGRKAIVLDSDIDDEEEQPPPRRRATEGVHVKKTATEVVDCDLSSQDVEPKVISIGSSEEEDDGIDPEGVVIRETYSSEDSSSHDSMDEKDTGKPRRIRTRAAARLHRSQRGRSESPPSHLLQDVTDDSSGESDGGRAIRNRSIKMLQMKLTVKGGKEQKTSPKRRTDAITSSCIESKLRDCRERSDTKSDSHGGVRSTFPVEKQLSITPDSNPSPPSTKKRRRLSKLHTTNVTEDDEEQAASMLFDTPSKLQIPEPEKTKHDNRKGKEWYHEREIGNFSSSSSMDLRPVSSAENNSPSGRYAQSSRKRRHLDAVPVARKLCLDFLSQEDVENGMTEGTNEMEKNTPGVPQNINGGKNGDEVEPVQESVHIVDDIDSATLSPPPIRRGKRKKQRTIEECFGGKENSNGSIDDEVIDLVDDQNEASMTMKDDIQVHNSLQNPTRASNPRMKFCTPGTRSPFVEDNDEDDFMFDEHQEKTQNVDQSKVKYPVGASALITIDESDDDKPPPFNLTVLCNNAESVAEMADRLGEEELMLKIMEAQKEGRDILGGEELGLTQFASNCDFGQFSRTVLAGQKARTKKAVNITEQALRGEYEFNYRGKGNEHNWRGGRGRRWYGGRKRASDSSGTRGRSRGGRLANIRRRRGHM